jgi:hypothetical protein
MSLPMAELGRRASAFPLRFSRSLHISDCARAAVLQDVVRTMYNPKFILELFRSQELYSVQATRQIFDRLAHSSIMRLNESSMDKVRQRTGRALSTRGIFGSGQGFGVRRSGFLFSGSGRGVRG